MVWHHWAGIAIVPDTVSKWISSSTFFACRSSTISASVLIELNMVPGLSNSMMMPFGLSLRILRCSLLQRFRLSCCRSHYHQSFHFKEGVQTGYLGLFQHGCLGSEQSRLCRFGILRAMLENERNQQNKMQLMNNMIRQQ